MKRTVRCEQAPKAIGPYSQAVIANGMVFCSGQIALDVETGELVGDTAGAQTERVMQNLSAVLQAAGSSIDQVVKATIYVTDLGDFHRVNQAYAAFFGADPPARACVEVSALPKGARVEIDAVALVKR